MRKAGGEGVRLMCLALGASLASSSAASAQGGPSWADELFGTSRGRIEPGREFEAPQWVEPRRDFERGQRSQAGGDVRDGGPRPEITPVAPATVAFAHD